MSFYPKNAAPFDPGLFQSPTAEYRGAPFWSWNCKLDRAQLLRQIDVFKAMGMGGFHMHSRTGLATEYLGDEFLALVRACVERAEQTGMLAWLYDEDRWPSGFAGGIVTSDPRFRVKQLLFSSAPYGEAPPSPAPGKRNRISRTARAGNGTLLGRYHVLLCDGRLAGYRKLAEGQDAPADGAVWYAYLETGLATPWFNNQTYVDTLSQAAIERFVEVTHERYAQAVGRYFGGVIPAIFTDEPQFVVKRSLSHAAEAGELLIPWTEDLPETFRQAYSQSIEDHLPELFWELPDGQASVARYRYHDHIAERFAGAFADTVGAWCEANGLMLTGHMMEEPTLESQTAAVGEVMRPLRAFGLPGIDMLCDRREHTTAKQAQSVARQYGRPGVLSELYGVTNWDFDFVGHKAQGDWQAALGVTVRVHHLTWASMGGEAKRDYPASIGEHSPWYREYHLIEDHFARVNTALTRGAAQVRVGVIHPIESFWLCYGPLDQTSVEREERERAFADLTDWLLFGLIDFDYIAESLLPELTADRPPTTDHRRPTTDDRQMTKDQGPRTEDQGPRTKDDQPSSPVSRLRSPGLPVSRSPVSRLPSPVSFPVGAMRYDVVVLPGMRTIRSTTLDRLERFRAAGGTLIFAGEVPALVDAEPSERARELAARSERVELTRGRLLGALSAFREVAARQADGRPADSLLHQIRIDGDRRYAFFCNTDRDRARPATEIAITGEWRATVLDTLNGTTYPLRSELRDGATCVEWDFAPHGSLLLALEPGWRDEGVQPAPRAWAERGRLSDPVPVTLSEPNVLLLDQAAYRLNDEPWQPVEEILRLDSALRRRLGLPLRMDWVVQPWADRDTTTSADTLSLRFAVQVDVAVDAPALALENAAGTRIAVDGQPVPSEITGWFVDQAIQTVRLPRLAQGAHQIELTLPYGRNTNPEWCYLLGDFGVELRGRHARVVAPVRELAWGDWTRQGLPFYAGNVTYHCTIEGGAELALRTPLFKAPLLTVALDGQERSPIAFAPFQIELGALPSGPHALDITAYGNRVNTFGCVHNADKHAFWFGPNAWRTEGDEWSYEYQLKPMGLLVAPRLMIEETKEHTDDG